MYSEQDIGNYAWVQQFGFGLKEFALSNIRSFTDLERAVKISHSFDVPIFITMNGLDTKEQYPLVIKEIKKAIEIGVDYLIIADVGLLLKLKELNIKIKIQISTGANVFNSNTIDFYKKVLVNKYK